ncbi:Adhesion G-protein coupled receptor G6 [Holothuria leucospilota]|uniref:Adhesion G-protein coupled receptor G6 n=1 Tax=Holothuria leucospilota TaxID=206669 RepID=A0A9Q1C104_HOLLE|nr:Adhesion G-protein coupled receptor G6 [Holothuria leucospilota]
MDIKTYVFLFCTIGVSSVSDGQSCISPSKCVMDSTKSYFQFGGYLDASGKAKPKGSCINSGGNGKICPVRPFPRLVTYGQSSGNPKNITCYGFENNIFGCRRRGSCHPRRVICRSYDDTPVYPPVLKARLKVKNYHEVNIGESLSIKCEADNATSYEWNITTSTGTKIDTSQTVSIENADYENQGIYICRALGNKGHDVSEPQVVVVKGYLQFLVEFEPGINHNLSTSISDELHQEDFKFSNFADGDQRRDVFKLLNGTTAPNAYLLLNTTLRNLFVRFPSWTYNINKTGYCPFEEVNEEYVKLRFNATLVGVIANSTEISLTSTSVARATRRCDGNYEDAAIWDEPVITNVKNDAKENITQSITNLVNNIAEQGVTTDNSSYVADVLKNVTETDQLETQHIDKVVEVLHDVVMANDTSEKVTISIVLTVNNLVITSDSNETEGRLSPNTSASLLQAFEQQIDNVRDHGEAFNFTSTTIEVYVIRVVDVDVWVIYRTYFLDEEDITNASLNTEIYETESDDGTGGNAGKGGDYDTGNGSSGGNNQESDQTNNNGTDQPGQTSDGGEGKGETTATDIRVDRPAVEGSINTKNDSNGFPISFLLHRRTTLFNGGSKDDTKINTLIVSASVNGDVKDLPDESNIFTSFHPIERHRCAKPSCVFWDPSLNDGIGDWSTDGCHSVESQQGEEQYSCRCNHLTNFAVLLDVKGDIGSKILDYLTVIGCVVSVWCIVPTIFSYLGIKKLRTSRPQQIVLNICFALLGLYLSFLAGIDQTHNHIPCVIFGALIHYFTLATVTWMSVEAVNMYLLFVKIFNAQINYFMIKASVIGWGVYLLSLSLPALYYHRIHIPTVNTVSQIRHR